MHQISRHTLSNAVATATLALAAGISSAAVAQGFTLEEVVVTARKREETLQDIPVAVSAYDAGDLKSLNMTETSDLAAFTPSVHIEQPTGQAGNIAKVTIRGQVQSDVLVTLDPSVGWYLDDVYLSRPVGTNNSLFDVDRVEILKGPQGTLYGRNTTGGTIKLVTAKADPSAETSGFVTGGIGNFEQSRLGGAINIPVIPNQLAVRLTALKDVQDKGFQDVTVYDGNLLSPTRGQVIGHQNNGTKDNELLRLGVTWTPTDNLSVLFSYEHSESDMTMAYANTSLSPGSAIIGYPFVHLGFPTPLQPLFQGFFTPFSYVGNTDPYDVHLNNANSNKINSARSETDLYSLTLEYEISDDLSTKLVYGRREVDNIFNTDIDGTNIPFSVFVEPFTSDGEQDSLEWQLNGSAMDGDLEWVTGLYWFEETGSDRSRSGGLSKTTAVNFVGGIPTGVYYSISDGFVDANKSKSAFFQGTLHLTDTLNFTGGVRYTKDTKPVKVIAAQVPFTGTAGTFCRFSATSGVPNINTSECSWADSDSYEFISWTAGFDWSLSDDMMAYLKGSSASRSGGQNLRGLDAATTQPFKPETATDIELGLKGAYFDNTLQVNAAYYHTFYTDIQQSLLINTPSGLITTVVNADEADIDGIELEAKWVVTEQLMLTGTLSWLDWEFSNETSILQAAPTLEYALRANYLIPTAYGQWLFDLNYSYRGEYPGNCALGRACVDNFAPATSDELKLLGGRIGVDIDAYGLNVALWARNLTDEEYILPGLQLYFPPNATLSNDTMGMPRSYGLEFTYSF